MRPPSYHHERELADTGFATIGIDEAGCGCLAGPVVAAAIHLPLDARIGDIRDSKLLSAAQRERLRATFVDRGFRWAIGVATVEEIDRVNIRQATYLAMRRAIDAFCAPHESSRVRPRRIERSPGDRSEISPFASGSVEMTRLEQWFALVDAWTIPGLPIPQRGIIHGDRLVKSIAAASIIAKVERDRMMDALDCEYSQYGFAIHRGYATAVHRAAIIAHGMSPMHRKAFCRNVMSVVRQDA